MHVPKSEKKAKEMLQAIYFKHPQLLKPDTIRVPVPADSVSIRPPSPKVDTSGIDSVVRAQAKAVDSLLSLNGRMQNQLEAILKKALNTNIKQVLYIPKDTSVFEDDAFVIRSWFDSNGQQHLQAKRKEQQVKAPVNKEVIEVPAKLSFWDKFMQYGLLLGLLAVLGILLFRK